MRDLTQEMCRPLPAGTPPLSAAAAGELLGLLKGWSRVGDAIVKTFRFANYHDTIAFVNASAWISHREDHHPELTVGFGECRVAYSTHSVGGLSENDFICAAKLDALVRL